MPGKAVHLQDEMADIVVREIWSRSKLSKEALARVWDLVDERRIGSLTRQQFVVGMWLITRNLSGKELPYRVPENIWISTSSRIGSTGIDLRVD